MKNDVSIHFFVAFHVVIYINNKWFQPFYNHVTFKYST